MGYLINFTYEHYCQGYEDANITALVYAESYASACEKLKSAYLNARDFRNRTLR